MRLEHMVTDKFEYKFVRMGLEGALESRPREDYKQIIAHHAEEGWRLVQIFAPPVLMAGRAPYFEIVFERAV